MHENSIESTITDPGTIIEKNLNRLKELFPSAFIEGKVDFLVLRQILGDAVDEFDEKFGLNWHGKHRARQIALLPSTGTLRPCPDDSLEWETTNNLMIEGDNLEVLKLLQKSFAGKVKLIYIDPPYNTGKDFIYADDFTNSIKNYLQFTGQVDTKNRKISSNTETSGRFHTDWLNMIYPRILLSRSLLKNDGVIMISIDDTEVSNLRTICDEIFGSENFCGTFVWERKKKPSFLDRNMGSVTEYIVTYAKNRSATPPFIAGSVEYGKRYPFNNAGNPSSVLCFPPFSVSFSCEDQQIKAQDMSEGNIVTKLLDDVDIVAGTNSNKFRLEGEWRYSQTRLDEFVAKNSEITISKVPFRPNYISRSGEVKKTSNLLSYRLNSVPTNEDATQEMRVLFGADVMSYPKPSGLLKYLIRAVSMSEDIVMDFFAGSGTTAGGVLQQSLEDGITRRYILVQLPEPISAANKSQTEACKMLESINKPKNIAELTKEYLRRTGARIRKENPLFSGDLGFRAFTLDSSNIREWLPNGDDLEASLSQFVENIKPSSSDLDILFEVLIRLGLDLSTPIQKRKISGKDVYSVSDGVLFACLSLSITQSDAETLGLEIVNWSEEHSANREVTCIFRDSAFEDDIAKINLTTYLLESGLSSVRCL